RRHLSVPADAAAEHAFDHPVRGTSREPELETSAERMSEQGHPCHTQVVEGELQAAEPYSEAPPLGKRLDLGDDDADAVREKACHRNVDTWLHRVAVQEHDRRSLADRYGPERASSRGRPGTIMPVYGARVLVGSPVRSGVLNGAGAAELASSADAVEA